jgi:intracellular septation protein
MKRLALDIISTVLFLAIGLLTKNVYLATGIGLAVGLAQVAWQKLHRQPVDGLQWLSLIFVMIFGALSVVTQNPRILILKPAIMECALGIYLLRHPEYSFIYAPSFAKKYVPLKYKILFGYLWAAGMFGLAISGLLVAEFSSLQAWAIYKMVAGPSMMVLLGLAASIFLPPVVRRERAAAAAAQREAQVLQRATDMEWIE